MIAGIYTRGSARRRLLRGLGASALGPITTAIIQVAGIPVFLHFWGPRLYGEWLILSALPTYLSLSDMGFGSVAGNDMTMRVAAGDRAGALESFQSTWLLITVVSMLLGLGVCGGVWLLPLQSWLHLSLLSRHEVSIVIMLLGTYALVALQAGLVVSGFRCEGNYPAGMLGANLVRLMEWIVATLAVAFGAGVIGVAASYLIVRAAGMLILNLIMRRKSPWLERGLQHASWPSVRRLAAPAFAFMAFPAGNALSIQGMVIVVGLVLGPVAVVAFSTLRTLTRFAFQILEAIKNAIWPELSAAFGAENLEFARRLHRQACQAALWLCFVAVAFLALAGPSIYAVWTHGRIALEPMLFYWLLAVVIANSFWHTSSAVAVACNAHQSIALAYILGTSSSIAVAYVLMPWIGLSGAAIALLVIDLAMSWYVLRNSLRILDDHASGFLLSLVKLPKLPRPLWNF